jgi:hypothetical protein
MNIKCKKKKLFDMKQRPHNANTYTEKEAFDLETLANC